MMSDMISRQAILKHIEKIRQGVQMMDDTRRASIIMNGMYLCEKAVRNQPSAEPELTDDRAIEYLQSTGWMQNHDREMYESGLREQLADESWGYDSLIPCDDTISRQAAIDAIDKWEASHSWDSWCYRHKDDANEYNISAPSAEIEKIPSVQPEIVRCKDCKHHHRDNSGAYYCGRKECGYGWGLNDFCSFAERRAMRRLIDADALIAEMHNVILEDGEDRRTFYEVIERQPTIEPEWEELLVICDNCGHAIRVKRH